MAAGALASPRVGTSHLTHCMRGSGSLCDYQGDMAAAVAKNFYSKSEPCSSRYPRASRACAFSRISSLPKVLLNDLPRFLNANERAAFEALKDESGDE